MFQKKFSNTVLLLSMFTIGFTSCQKWIAVDPPSDQLVGSEVFKHDATARAAVTGIYTEMMNNINQFTTHGVSLYTGMSADELSYYSPGTRDEFVHNNLTVSNHAVLDNIFWTPAYRYIVWANTSIENLKASGELTASVQQTLLGEAKFIRAFCYFHLANLFGAVPLVVQSDYRVNQDLPRASRDLVEAQLIRDLTEAFSQAGYDPANGSIRPNKWAAAALLARVYLYRQDWGKAAEWSDKVIRSGNYILTQNLQNVFLKDSKETIWQLQPVNPTRNTWEGNLILPASASSMPTYLLRPELVTAFETGDERRNAWTKSRVYAGQTVFYPFKYKVQSGSALTESYVVLRLAEQYLIRAEARLNQGDIPGSLQDLNSIRLRAGLPPITVTDPVQVSAALAHERRIELFAEWGHRWFDLKRTGRATAVLGALKGTDWTETDQLYPIPIGQLNANQALTQNPGY